MKTKLLTILIVTYGMFYGSSVIGQEAQKQDALQKIPKIFRMDMGDTLNIDTTKVVDTQYAQESKEAKFGVMFN